MKFSVKIFQAAIVALVLSIIVLQSAAQQKVIPLNFFFTNETDRAVLKDSVARHTAIKPLLESDFDLTGITGFQKDSIRIYEKYQKFLFTSHLFSVKKDDYFLAIDPLFNFTLQFDDVNKRVYDDSINLYQNTRGLQAIGDIGNKFSFQTSFYENQAYIPAYQKAFADSTLVIPGMGRWKPYKFLGYDYAMATGWISYKPAKWLNLQFGNGKQFIGHGYRSLLLSDAAFSYPYIKGSFRMFDGKLVYNTIYASLQTLERLPVGEVPESLFKRKGGTFNYLSWMPNQYLELGLFEGIIWQRYTEEDGTRRQAFGAYVPVLGLNAMNLGFNNKHNVIAGANARIKVTDHMMIYGQFVYDNPKRNSTGWQAGLKYFDLILRNLDVQLEWNSLGDYLYASSYPLQSYSHFNQPLGHPSGPASDEMVAIISYRKKRIIGRFKFNQIRQQLSPQGNWRSLPSDEILSDRVWPNKTTQQFDIQAGLLINPKTNLQVLGFYTYRNESTQIPFGDKLVGRSNIYGITLKTNLINLYNDF